MEYTYLHNIAINQSGNILETKDCGFSFKSEFHESMKPELKYMLLSRDVITDDVTKEKSAIRIFDTIFIPKGWAKPYFYSFYCMGRIFLGTTGLVKSTIKATICDPTGKEIRTISTLEGTFNADYAINFSPLLFAIPFDQEGRYSIQTSVNINGGEFVDVGERYYFQVSEIK
jgi:hypothetical protein